MRRKLKYALPLVVLLVAAGAAYKLVLASGGKAERKQRIPGVVVPLQPEFVVNLAGGYYGKVSVALVLAKAPPTSAEGAPVLEQDAAVRAAITDVLTGLNPADLIERDRRHRLVARLTSTLRHTTDEPITGVLLTDVAVQ